MADPHLAIYNRLDDMDKTLNAIKEASDVEPVLNDILRTLVNINNSLVILRDENEHQEYMGELKELNAKVKDLSSAVTFIANNQ